MGELPHVKSCGQTDLDDDGRRCWDDQVRDLLDSDYPGWQNPCKTYMLPRDFSYKSRNPDAGDKAEKHFYNLLWEFGEKRNEKMFVVHSHGYAELIPEWDHGFPKTERGKTKKWVTGEHDFVIIHRQHGVVFFQVKAAVKKSKAFIAAQKQIQKDQLSLKIFAQRDLKGECKKQVGNEIYSYPGFVVMPNCPKGNESGVFAEDCQNVEAFSAWWDKNIRRKGNTVVDQEAFESLVMRFVGLSHARASLSHVIAKNHSVIEFKTRQQLEILLQSPSKQWVTGPAGSGKTWILIEKVKILAKRIEDLDLREDILVVCYNVPLSKWLEKIFQASMTGQRTVEVKTFDSLICSITKQRSSTDEQKSNAVTAAFQNVLSGSFLKEYDHIFVDEGQDLYGEKWPELFEHLLKKPNCDSPNFEHSKHLWVMYDTNQNLCLSEERYNQHLQDIKGSFKLSKVLRNTQTIFEQTNKYFRCIEPTATDVEIGHQVTGLQIRWDNSLSRRKATEKEGAEIIASHIKELQGKNIKQRDICVLVENVSVRDNCISELKSKGVNCQNAEELTDDKVIVESTRRFKGLESKVIVLYNPRFYEGNTMSTRKVKELLYTAMTRCFCYLIVITSEAGCKALKSAKGFLDQGTSPSHQMTTEMTSLQMSQEETSGAYKPLSGLSDDSDSNDEAGHACPSGCFKFFKQFCWK